MGPGQTLLKISAIWCDLVQWSGTSSDEGERSGLSCGLATGWLSRMIKGGDFEMRSARRCGCVANDCFEHEDTLAQGGVAGLLAEAAFY